LWVSAEGIIYEEFDPATHVLEWDYDDNGKRLPLPYDWDRYWVIDFGLVHPFVLKCYAYDSEDDTLYMYREIYHTQRTIEEHASQIMSLVARKEIIEWYDHFNKTMRTKEETVWTEPKPVAVICDHDAQGRRTFENVTGLGTQPAVKNVYEGINAHKERLKLNDEGYARFYLMEDALVERDQSLVDALQPTCTLDEYGSYVWKVSADGRTQDEPVKKDDDGVDCDRYMTSFLDLKGKARVTVIDR
jgi:phage terminase large subunit